MATATLAREPQPGALTPRPFVVSGRERNTADTWTLSLDPVAGESVTVAPGQFMMVYAFGIGEVPISVSGPPDRPGPVVLTVRAVGAVTSALCASGPGTVLGLRGPFGNSWPVDTASGDVVVVAGGIGLAPLRPLIEAILADRPKFGAFHVFLGARTPRDRLFVAQMGALAGRPDMEVAEIVDRAGPDWLGRVGIVTQLFDRATWDGRNAIAFICGPERMMQATATVLFDRGIDVDRTWVTLERNMACGVGLCGHCQLGRFFVCKDGPVFSLAELGPAFTTEGL